MRVLVIDELHNVLGRAAATAAGNSSTCCGSSATSCASRWSASAPGRPTWRSAPTISWRTGSSRSSCRVWEADEEACSLLASFAASFPLRRPSAIATPEMASYLLTRSEGTIGELAHLLTDAAIAAIESGEEAINQRTLLMAAYAGPTERRRLFERELT